MRRLRLFSTLALFAAPLAGCTDDSAGAGGGTDESGGIDPSAGPDSSGGAVDETTAADGSGGGDQGETGDGSCNDNVHNSSETDVDCGGSDCP
ncbi:MAG: hypothetical protein JKY37_28765, partial [Nannocystaceae bacterium]|nr:hypothetical protein [Nannocystaceae bacterium]